jgi:hypothetical protein
MDCHHDVSVATLRSERERPRLVGVNCVGEVLNAEESFMGLVIGMWWKGDLPPLILILTVSFSMIVSNAFFVLFNQMP